MHRRSNATGLPVRDTTPVEVDLIPLSPFEHVFTGAGSYPITFVFAFGERLDGGRLAKGLAETVALFPWVQSRLVAVGPDAYAFERDPGVGALEIREEARASLEADGSGSLIEPVETREGAPLARFRLTQGAHGSLLGVSLSHALADGFSFFHLLTSWARLVRGDTVRPPDRGTIPRASPEADGIDRQRVLSACGLLWTESQRSRAAESMREHRVLVTREELRAWREEARATDGIRVSENDLLAARLWRDFVPQWASGTTETFLTCPIDFRTIVKSLPRTHFGSGITFATARVDLTRLREASQLELAALVRAAVAEVDETRVATAAGTLERLRQERGRSVLEQLHVRHPESGLIVTNLTRMPIRDLDFGTGAPSDFRADAQVARGAALLPHEDGVEARVYLPAATATGP